MSSPFPSSLTPFRPNSNSIINSNHPSSTSAPAQPFSSSPIGLASFLWLGDDNDVDPFQIPIPSTGNRFKRKWTFEGIDSKQQPREDISKSSPLSRGTVLPQSSPKLSSSSQIPPSHFDSSQITQFHSTLPAPPDKKELNLSNVEETTREIETIPRGNVQEQSQPFPSSITSLFSPLRVSTQINIQSSQKPPSPVIAESDDERESSDVESIEEEHESAQYTRQIIPESSLSEPSSWEKLQQQHLAKSGVDISTSSEAAHPQNENQADDEEGKARSDTSEELEVTEPKKRQLSFTVQTEPPQLEIEDNNMNHKEQVIISHSDNASLPSTLETHVVISSSFPKGSNGATGIDATHSSSSDLSRIVATPSFKSSDHSISANNDDNNLISSSAPAGREAQDDAKSRLVENVITGESTEKNDDKKEEKILDDDVLNQQEASEVQENQDSVAEFPAIISNNISVSARKDTGSLQGESTTDVSLKNVASSVQGDDAFEQATTAEITPILEVQETTETRSSLPGPGIVQTSLEEAFQDLDKLRAAHLQNPIFKQRWVEASKRTHDNKNPFEHILAGIFGGSQQNVD